MSPKKMGGGKRNRVLKLKWVLGKKKFINLKISRGGSQGGMEEARRKTENGLASGGLIPR